MITTNSSLYSNTTGVVSNFWTNISSFISGFLSRFSISTSDLLYVFITIGAIVSVVIIILAIIKSFS